ncbi:MAG: hypothetical protein V8R01_00985 [Bacilli bacterium]
MMNDGMYTIVELSGEKWFTIAETIYNGNKFQYVIKLTPDEQNFINEFKVIKCLYKDGKEYCGIVTNQETLKIVTPMLIPEIKEYIDNPEKLKELIED